MGPMLIQTETTPNPATLKFLPGQTVMSGGTRDFAAPEEAEVSPLAEAIFSTETRVRPAVAQDGGDIVYRGFRGGTVYLALQGACSGCPSSIMTLKQGIEGLLKHYVPEVEAVEAV